MSYKRTNRAVMILGELGSRILFFFFFFPQKWFSFCSLHFWWEASAERGNSLQSVFKWMFVPVCDTTLSASSRAPLSCYYIDLTASRKLHFYQLLVARSENLLFISGVIFPPFSSISFSLICVLSPSTTWICKRKSEFLSPEPGQTWTSTVQAICSIFLVSHLASAF